MLSAFYNMHYIFNCNTFMLIITCIECPTWLKVCTCCLHLFVFSPLLLTVILYFCGFQVFLFYFHSRKIIIYLGSHILFHFLHIHFVHPKHNFERLFMSHPTWKELQQVCLYGARLYLSVIDEGPWIPFRKFQKSKKSI